MLPVLCFLAVCFVRVVFLVFLFVAFGLDCGLLIPGMFDMSCCARTAVLPISNIAAHRIGHSLADKLNLTRSMLFIYPLLETAPKKSGNEQRQTQRTDFVAGRKRADAFQPQPNAIEGLNQKHTDEDMPGRSAVGWCMLPWESDLRYRYRRSNEKSWYRQKTRINLSSRLNADH